MIRCDVMIDMVYDIFVNCNWVDTRWWQQYSTNLHTNCKQNNTIINFVSRLSGIRTQCDQTNLNSAGFAQSLRIIPWQLP